MTAWVEVTGWTLLHFVWQGTLIALATAVALRLLQDRGPHGRYAIACAGLALMLTAPLVTAALLATTDRAPVSVTRSDAPEGSRSWSGDLKVRVIDAPSAAGGTASPAAADVTRTLAGLGIEVNVLLSSIVGLWLGGVALLFLHGAGGYRRVRQLHRVAMLEATSRWSQSGRRIAARLGLSRVIRIVDSASVDTPTVIGWMQPVILLPIAALANLSPAQVDAILAHELAHVRRHDFTVNVLQTLVETLLFYHPGVWWLSRRIRSERENCCDDIAVEVCGDPYVYAAALTEIAAAGISSQPLAVAATGGSLLTRVRRLLDVKADATRDAGIRRATSALVVTGIVLTLVVAAGSLQLFSMAQRAESSSERTGFGPRDLNRLVGFQLLPGPPRYPGDDPPDAHSWPVRVGDGSRDMSIVGFTARNLIRDAYGLPDVSVEGTPAWMDGETFDLTIPSDVPIVVDDRSDPGAVNGAIRAYLEGVLNLRWHIEEREFPAFALVRTGPSLGPNLRVSTSDCRWCGIEDHPFGYTGKRATIADLVGNMMRRHSAISVGRTVVDRTGLTGTFDFEIRLGFLPLNALAHNRPMVATLFYPLGVRSFSRALPEQLGLTLEDTTVTRQVLVIDYIDRPPATTR